ncbi:MAG: cation diffusion facilitator family transporter [bacterium]|nr:cation diffusion facilitator family transporter [bacterium]
MTSLLVKKFVKNYELIGDSKVRTSYGILASVVGIICNLILSVTKLVIGTIIGSISVIADAFNNLSDAASSIISFIGVKMASRPADEEHPFGHGRYEYISALVVAFLVLQVGFSCFKSAIDKILHPEEVAFNIVLVGILVLSILIKIWLGIFNRTLGKRINSTVMRATSTDAFGDVLVTSATVASLLISKYSGVNIDGYMGIVVSIFVLIAGFNIAKDTLEPLLGEAVSKETYDLITKKVEGQEGIVGSHDLIVHSYGPGHIMATIHAEVPNNMSFEEAHELIDRVERQILRDENIFLVIHMDPIEVNDKEVMRARDIISKIVKELDDEASIHDFRLISEGEIRNLVFDLLVPHQYSVEQEEKIQQQVKNLAKAYDERYTCVITLEHGFICNK